jgi:regulator of sirC expression with transglutaminase-like and TPR domain
MTFYTEQTTALAYFSSLVQSDEHFPLLEAAASLGQDVAPNLNVGAVLEELDRMVARVKVRIPADAPPLQRLRILNRYFYGELGFGGNVNHYYDPANSYVSSVLSKRLGIPITLAVIWLELAESIGLKSYGVSFPGHFLVKIRLPDGQAVMDPVTGLSLSRDELTERLLPFIRHNKVANSSDMDVVLALYLQSATPREIVVRMLRNLKEIFLAEEDWPKLIQILDRLTVVAPHAWDYFKERGLIHAEQGQIKLAEDDLQVYLRHGDNAEDIKLVEERLRELRSTRE